MQRLRLVLLLMPLLLVIPALAQDGTPAPQPTPQSLMQMTATAEVTAEADLNAHIRVAHLSPDTPPLSLFIDGEPVRLQSLSYLVVSGWIDVPGGTHSIVVAPLEETLAAPVAQVEEQRFAPGDWITIAVVGSQENNTLSARLIVEDYRTPIPAGQARLTVYHALEGAPNLDVRLGDTALNSGLAYGESFSADAAAGTYDLRFLDSSSQNALFTLTDVQIAAETLYFIALTGTPGNPQSVVALVGMNQVANPPPTPQVTSP